MSTLRDTLEPAKIEWRDNNKPFNTLFNDVYFSDDAIAESDYIYLNHNHLSERWIQPCTNFCISEIGFGTGLNFLLSRQLWQQQQTSDKHLHFISVEKHPLHKEDLCRALSAFPSLATLSQELLEQYPPLLTGQHTLHFRDNSITLHLLFGDATEMLHAQLISDPPPDNHQGFVDAWFLDGFAPKKNPELWQQQLFTIIRQLSHQHSSYATFSAAAMLKNNLLEAGFSVNAHPSFDLKCHILAGKVSTAIADNAPKRANKAGHYRHPKALWPINQHQSTSKNAVIIGAGIAGCCTALALAQRGYNVKLIDADSLCAGASGNPQPALYTRFSPYQGPANDFSLHAYLYALRFYPQHLQQPPTPSGLLQLVDEKDLAAYQKLLSQLQHSDELTLLSPAEASTQAGSKIGKHALFIRNASWIDSKAFCEGLIQHKNIQFLPQTQISLLARHNDSWQLHNNNNVIEHSGPVILCLGAAQHLENLHPALQHLPMKAIRGQVNYLAATEQSRQLRNVICDESFMAPAYRDQHSFGASYAFDTDCSKLNIKEQQQNVDNLQQLLPDLVNPTWQNAAKKPLAGRVSLRAVTPDYLPMVGPVADPQAFISDYASLHKNANYVIRKTGQYLPQLYVNTAYGSRGLNFAPLCAQLLAAQIDNSPLPLPANLVHALSPARFIIKNICRGHFATAK